MFGLQYRDLLMISLLFDTSCPGSGTIPIQTVTVNGTANIHWSLQATNIHFIEIKHNNMVNIVLGRPDKLLITDDRLSAIIRESEITLTITNVRYKDAGIYTCLINIAQESKDVQLIVSELEKGSTVNVTETVPSTSIRMDDKTDLQWPGDEGSDRVELIVMVVIGLMVLFFILLAANTLYFRRKFIRGERVDSIGMVAHSYESINSAIHSRGESSVTQNADTSAVASGQELSINTNAILNAGILASNLSLPDDEDAIPISHDNDGVNEMNEISTVMTGPNHLTSARETLLTGNTRIAAGTISNASASNEMNDISTVMTGPDHLTSALETLLTGNTRIAAGTISNVSASNEHRGECASYRNNYEQHVYKFERSDHRVINVYVVFWSWLK